ncbi:MAG: hypothetical protein WC379_12980 [Methanoregula sp.]|jgi:hypothetical protein
MERKMLIIGFLLVCVVVGTAVILSPVPGPAASTMVQASTGDIVLEKTLPNSPATAVEYRVMKTESVFEGSERLFAVKSDLPSESEAPAMAAKILEKYGGLPKDAVIKHVGTVSMQKYNTETEITEEQYPQFTQVIYSQQINGSPVIGPGAEINICLGPGGEMLQIEKAWRHLEFSREVPVISSGEAFVKLKKHDLLVIPQSSLAGITIGDVRLGYYAEDRQRDQTVYSPVWIFYGTKTGGEPFPYVVDARQ